jgi:hypothetical protein
VHVVGKDDPSIDRERCPGAHSPNRIAQRVETRHQQAGAPVKQFTPKEECSARNPIAAIIRHARSMPGLGERRNALRCSALRLLWGGPLPSHRHRSKRPPEAVRRATLQELADSYDRSISTMRRVTRDCLTPERYGPP